MNETARTTNIPDSLPIKVDPTSENHIRAWMATRPEVPRCDGALDENSRWEYRIVDFHIFSAIKVIDLAEPAEFNVPIDVDKL